MCIDHIALSWSWFFFLVIGKMGQASASSEKYEVNPFKLLLMQHHIQHTSITHTQWKVVSALFCMYQLTDACDQLWLTGERVCPLSHQESMANSALLTLYGIVGIPTHNLWTIGRMLFHCATVEWIFKTKTCLTLPPVLGGGFGLCYTSVLTVYRSDWS